jgi:hypothetical protein
MEGARWMVDCGSGWTRVELYARRGPGRAVRFPLCPPPSGLMYCVSAHSTLSISMPLGTDSSSVSRLACRSTVSAPSAWTPPRLWRRWPAARRRSRPGWTRSQPRWPAQVRARRGRAAARAECHSSPSPAVYASEILMNGTGLAVEITALSQAPAPPSSLGPPPASATRFPPAPCSRRRCATRRNTHADP